MTRWLTRQSVWIVLLLALAVPAQAQTWPNEPSGATVLLDCGFSSQTCNGELWIGSPPTIVTDATAPLSPSQVGESRIQAGASDGGAWFGKTISPAISEIYVGLWWKLADPWEGAHHGGNKLYFVNSADALSLMSFHNPPFSSIYVIAWTTDGAQIDAANAHIDGLGVQSHFGFGCTVQPGQWILLEVYMRSSITWSDKSGIVKWWVNGQLCGNYTNVNFPGGFVDWQNNQTWAGLDGISFPKPTIDWWHRFDHVRISTCTGCAVPTDQDGDGIHDSSDQCPTIPGPGPTGCPPPTDTIAPMPPDQFEVTRQGGPILPPPAPTGPSSGGDAGFMF